MKEWLAAAGERLRRVPGRVAGALRASIRDVFLFGGLLLVGVGLWGYDWRVASVTVGAAMVGLWALPMVGGRVGEHGDQ